METDIPDTSLNDGKTGPDGRLYFGTRDLAQRCAMGGLYRLDDLVARRLADRVTAGNGLDWSPDTSVLYFVDSGDYLVWAFDFDSRDSSVSRKRVFASVAEPDGLPDGLTVDAAGGVWVALFGGDGCTGTHRTASAPRLSRCLCATRPPAPSPVPAWTRRW